MKAGLVATLLAVAFAVVWAPSGASAEATITASTVQNGFPRNIVFSLEATADVEITDVTLAYQITGRNSSALGKPTFLNSETSIDTEVTVTTGTSSYIPVASEFIYHWELELADGTTTIGPDETFLYLPPGDEWEDIENDIVRVYYQGNRLPTASEYLSAGLETYQQVAVETFGIELPILPVKVVLFAEEADLEAARPGSGGTLDAAVVNCGTKVTSDIVFVIHRSCGTDDQTDTFRHEFGHIINEAAGEGPLGILPSWLDEGMAVHAQSDPGNNYLGAVDAAIRSNRLIPFGQMGTAASDANQVNLFYGQAWAMVEFLIQTGGTETFSDYFATIKAGSRFDNALLEVYGFSLGEFEEAFYEANGVSSGPAVAPTSSGGSQSNPTPVATRPPLQTSTPGDDDDGVLGPVVIAAIGAAVLFALVAVFFYLMSTMMANNRKATVAPAPPEDDQWRPPPPPTA